MAKRERDGWMVEKDTAGEFRISGPSSGVEWASACATRYGTVIVDTCRAKLPPARAAQFAAKVAAIAAKAAKEAKDGR